MEANWASICCTPSPIIGVSAAEPGRVIVTPQNFSVFIVDVETCKKLAVWNIEEAISFTLPTVYCAFNKRYYAVANNTLILELAIENELATVKGRFAVQNRVAQIIVGANPIFIREDGVVHILVDNSLWTLEDQLKTSSGAAITNVSRSVLHLSTFELTKPDGSTKLFILLVQRDGTLQIGRMDDSTNTLQFQHIKLTQDANDSKSSSRGQSDKARTITCFAKNDACLNCAQFAVFWSDQSAESLTLSYNSESKFSIQQRSPIQLRSTTDLRVSASVGLSGDWFAIATDARRVHLVNARIGLLVNDSRFSFALPARDTRVNSTPAQEREAGARIEFDRTTGSLLCFVRNELFAMRIDGAILRSNLADLVSTSRREPTSPVANQQATHLEARIVDELLAILTAKQRNMIRLNELIATKVTEAVCVGELKRLDRTQLSLLFEFLADRLRCSLPGRSRCQVDGEAKEGSSVECVVHWLTMLIDAQMGAFVTFGEFHRRLADTLAVVRGEVKFLDAASSVAALAEQVEKLIAVRRISKKRKMESAGATNETYSLERLFF